MKIRKLRCYRCGHVHDILTYDLLEYDHPQILDGTLFSVECEMCQTMNFFDYPIMIKHPELLIAYKNENQEANRWVYSQDDLIEKANILKEGFDDRVIEILKMLFRQRVIDTPIVHFTQANNDLLEFRVVKDKKYQLFTQSLFAYDNLVLKAMDLIQQLSLNEKVIDYKWARENIDKIVTYLYHKDKH